LAANDDGVRPFEPVEPFEPAAETVAGGVASDEAWAASMTATDRWSSASPFGEVRACMSTAGKDAAELATDEGAVT